MMIEMMAKAWDLDCYDTDDRAARAHSRTTCISGIECLRAHRYHCYTLAIFVFSLSLADVEIVSIS